MENQERNVNKIYYRPVHDWIEVSLEVKKDWERNIGTIRKRKSRNGECCIPYCKSYQCDGMCDGCEFSIKKNVVSLDQEMKKFLDGESSGNIFSDPALITELDTEKIFLREKLRALKNSAPDDYRILMYFAMGLSERECADNMGMSRSTYVYKRNQLIDALRKEFLV